MKCSATPETLREPAEKALRDLGCEFYTNRTVDLLEFEVVKPENFIARMTRLGPMNHSFSLTARLLGQSLSPSPKGGEETEVEIITFGQTSTASKFVEKMVANMASPPWSGMRRSGLVKEEWKKWLSGR